MITEISSFEKLIEEFSNIRVVIEIGPRSFALDDTEVHYEDGTSEIEIVSEFFVKFQDEERVFFTHNNNFYDGYLKSLDKVRLNFYKEINHVISESNNKFHLLNLLSDYKMKFSELFDNYYNYEINKPGGTANFKGNRIIQYSYSDEKPIDVYYKDRILDKYLNIQFKSIENILRYIDEKINLIKFQPREENHVLKPTLEIKRTEPKIPKKNSFELNRERYKEIYKNDPENIDVIIDEKLKNFHEALYKYGFIEKIEYRYFLHAFSNKKVVRQIRWERDAKELYYLIKALYDQELIVRFKNYWAVACICFKAYHKRSNICTAYSLSHCHAPTLGGQLTKLKSAIDTLK